MKKQEKWARLYQEDGYQESSSFLTQGLNPILCLPTGSGKTFVAQQIVNDFLSEDRSVLFLAHRSELVRQFLSSFKSLGNLTASTIQSFKGWSSGSPDLIVVDECHHVSAPMYQNVLRDYSSSKRFGLSATPLRLDGRSLKGFFDVIVQPATTTSLIEEGYLAGLRLFAPKDLVESQLNLDSRFFDLESKLSCAAAVEEYVKHANNKRGIVFCRNISHSRRVTECYKSSGIKAVCIDGFTSRTARNGVKKAWEERRLDVIVNCELYTEGIDLPCVEFVQILRQTESLALYFQMIGRGMRPGDDLILLDHTSNWATIGLPSDDFRFFLDDGKGGGASIATSKHKRFRTESGEVLKLEDSEHCEKPPELIEIEKTFLGDQKEPGAKKSEILDLWFKGLSLKYIARKTRKDKRVITAVVRGVEQPASSQVFDAWKEYGGTQDLGFSEISKKTGLSMGEISDILGQWENSMRSLKEQALFEFSQYSESESISSKERIVRDIARQLNANPQKIRSWCLES